jgi:hypothetical protein
MQLSMDIDHVTFGDLYNFADAARAADVPEDRAVEQVTNPLDDTILESFRVELPDLNRRVVTIGHDDRLEFAAAVGRVLATEGDARAVLDELERLRDVLLGT